MRRIVSLWLPQFPIERLVRDTPELATSTATSQPLVLVQAGAHGLRLAACSPTARSLGLKPGERLADARARIPHLVSRPHAPGRDAAVLMQLARWSERWSPFIAPDPPDGLILDVTGIPHLFGGEPALLSDMAAKFRRLGFTAAPALAGTATAARAAARYASPFAIVPPGGEAGALAALPVEALGLDAGTCQALRRLGLKRIGQLNDLPRASLARRFREAMASPLMVKLDQALGRADTPLAPLGVRPAFTVREALLEPLVSHDGVIGLVEHLAHTFCARLETAGRGALRLSLKLYRMDGSRAVAPLNLVQSCHDPSHLARLIAPRLEGLDLGYGIEAATLEAIETAALAATQNDFIADRAHGAGRAHGSPLAELADRILNRHERPTLARLAAAESHVPERAERTLPPLPPTPAPGSGPGQALPHEWGGRRARPSKPPSPSLILRRAEGPSRRRGEDGGGAEAGCRPRPVVLFDRPEPVEAMAAVPDGPPIRFTWRRVARPVARAEGPERIAPEWWRDGAGRDGATASTRDYYVIEDPAGRRYWLFREGLYGEEKQPAWFIHGLFA